MWQYIAVAVGAWVGMLWPFIVKLLRGWSPGRALQIVPSLARGASPGPKAKFIGWLILTLIVAAVVAALNIVPLVTGDMGEKLKLLGEWQYFFLAAEGFALAAFVNEGIRPS